MRPHPLLGTIVMALVVSAPAPALADQYDYAILELPVPLQAGALARIDFFGKPTFPFWILGDTGPGPTSVPELNGLRADLDFSPNLVVLYSGFMPDSGRLTLYAALPDDPALYGAVYYFQGFVKDPSVATFGWALSNSVRREILAIDGSPYIQLLTVNEIPADENGSDADDGVIKVPSSNFTVDLHYQDYSGTGVDPASLLVVSDHRVAGLAPGTNLASFFTIGQTSAHWQVQAGQDLELATHVFSASLKNNAGQVSNIATSTLTAATFTSATQPFDNTDVWWLDFTLDKDGDGTVDYDVDLSYFGLAYDPFSATGAEAFVREWTKDALVFDAKVGYSVLQPDGTPSPDPVNIDFVKDKPASGTYSHMCVGGRNTIPPNQLPPTACETTGSAFVDHDNQQQEDDCGDNLGVQPRSFYYLFKDVPEFKSTFDPLIWDPVGLDPVDDLIFSPSFDRKDPNNPPEWNARWDEVAQGVADFAKAVTFTVCQETGHSVGASFRGRLPRNLLGGPKWGHSTEFHYDDGRGDFMSGNNSTPAPCSPENLRMVYRHMLAETRHFTPLDLAYLRMHLIAN